MMDIVRVLFVLNILFGCPTSIDASAGNEWHYRGLMGSFARSVTMVIIVGTLGCRHWSEKGHLEKHRFLAPQTEKVPCDSDYDLKNLGPSHWHLDYPHCGGTKQSPINIITNDVIIDENRLQPIVFSGYDSVTDINMTLTNNGHSVQVNLNERNRQISHGGLPGVFIAEQFHFHWGAVDSRGSEHDIDGHFFPMEMHVVHYNTVYGKMKNAMEKDDGLAVLAFFFEVGRFNSHFEKIIDHFKDIHFKDRKSTLKSIPLIEFIPSNLEAYYRYQGSLTTPPCYESVTWTLFHETIEVAEEQLESFRTMIFSGDEPSSDGKGIVMDISDDFRPVQCLNNRKVYGSRKDLIRPNQMFLSDDPGGSGCRLSSERYVTIVTIVLATLLFGS